MIGVLQNPSARPVIAALGIGVIMAFVGPFGTFRELTLAARMLYWVPMVALGWIQWVVLGRLLSWLAEHWFGDWPGPWWGREAVLCIVAPLPLILEIVGMRTAFGLSTAISWTELYLWSVVTTLLICLLVVGTIFWAHSTVEKNRADAADDAPGCADPEFLRRLPPEKRGRLICLKTEDHYLRVYTDRGEALILFRLMDALRQLEGHEGHRVHRSYWVARNAVSGAKRYGRKTRLFLTNGLEVPVSETYLPHLKDAGWLT